MNGKTIFITSHIVAARLFLSDQFYWCYKIMTGNKNTTCICWHKLATSNIWWNLQYRPHHLSRLGHHQCSALRVNLLPVVRHCKVRLVETCHMTASLYLCLARQHHQAGWHTHGSTNVRVKHLVINIVALSAAVRSSTVSSQWRDLSNFYWDSYTLNYYASIQNV